MALMAGYNFVRSGAKNAFQASYQRVYGGKPECISIIGFLRMVRHEETPKHECLQVEGFERLWEVCGDPEKLSGEVHELLSSASNWLDQHLLYVYFVLDSDADFVRSDYLRLRLKSGRQIDLADVFSNPNPTDNKDHYTKPFALS